MTTSCTKIYPDKLADIVREYHYIPRLIRENEYLKRYHRYWSIDSEYYFKIYQTYKVDECEYYSVRYQNALLAEIPYPVDHNSTYDLALDYKKIYKRNIINSDISYYGSEIKYWFFINDINLHDEKYSGFWIYINPGSNSLISDNKRYYISAIEEDEIYKKCKMYLDN